MLANHLQVYQFSALIWSDSAYLICRGWGGSFHFTWRLWLRGPSSILTDVGNISSLSEGYKSTADKSCTDGEFLFVLLGAVFVSTGLILGWRLLRRPGRSCGGGGARERGWRGRARRGGSNDPRHGLGGGREARPPWSTGRRGTPARSPRWLPSTKSSGERVRVLAGEWGG